MFFVIFLLLFFLNSSKGYCSLAIMYDRWEGGPVLVNQIFTNQLCFLYQPYVYRHRLHLELSPCYHVMSGSQSVSPCPERGIMGVLDVIDTNRVDLAWRPSVPLALKEVTHHSVSSLHVGRDAWKLRKDLVKVKHDGGVQFDMTVQDQLGNTDKNLYRELIARQCVKSKLKYDDEKKDFIENNVPNIQKIKKSLLSSSDKTR